MQFPKFSLKRMLAKFAMVSLLFCLLAKAGVSLSIDGTYFDFKTHGFHFGFYKAPITFSPEMPWVFDVGIAGRNLSWQQGDGFETWESGEEIYLERQ